MTSQAILVGEIFLDGASPYPYWSLEQVISNVRAGARMEKPVKCPLATFNVIMKCWDRDPAKRPTFRTLKTDFDKLLGIEEDDAPEKHITLVEMADSDDEEFYKDDSKAVEQIPADAGGAAAAIRQSSAKSTRSNKVAPARAAAAPEEPGYLPVAPKGSLSELPQYLTRSESNAMNNLGLDVHAASYMTAEQVQASQPDSSTYLTAEQADTQANRTAYSTNSNTADSDDVSGETAAKGEYIRVGGLQPSSTAASNALTRLSKPTAMPSMAMSRTAPPDPFAGRDAAVN